MPIICKLSAAFFIINYFIAKKHSPYSDYGFPSDYRVTIVLKQYVMLQVVLLYVLKVAVGAHLEFIDGSLVGNDDGMGMHLQGTQCAHV